MGLIALGLFGLIIGSLYVTLAYLKEHAFSKYAMKTAKCYSCLFILYTQVKEISHSNFAIVGITLLLIYKFYYTHQSQISEYFLNQRLHSEQSENVFKINEPDLELPQNLPPIMSENESKSSSKYQQEPNTTARIYQEKVESIFCTKMQQKEAQKAGSNLSFLGDFKQSSFQKSQYGQNPQIKQSIPINSNVNLIKYSDDGEIKFGIMRTLRSINIDFIEKELEQLQKEPIISKTDQPKIQILYESSQPEISSANNEVQSRQSRHSKQSNNQIILQPPFKEVKTEQSILPIHAKMNYSERMSWQKILKQLVILMIYSFNKIHLILQITYLLAILCYQLTLFQLFNIMGLEIKIQCREILAWSLLIILPISVLYLSIELQFNILNFMAWLSILLASQKINYAVRNPKVHCPFIILLCLSSFLY